MKKIVWCVPLSFVTAVIFLLGNAASAQAATICGWTAISVGANEYIYTWSCYDNGDGGREDIKYGTRPGSTNPREGGGGGNEASESRAQSIISRILKNSCVKSGEDCGAFGVRLEKQCYLETGLNTVSRLCANFGNEAGIACSSGQIPSCP